MKKALYLLTGIMLILITACGNVKQIEQSEETTADIEAAQLAGRSDARRIINREFRDSMEFHGALLEANARRSEYEIADQPKCVAAYDSAFISTIRTVRPDLAKQLLRK